MSRIPDIGELAAPTGANLPSAVRICVVLDGGDQANRIVKLGHRLSACLGQPWEAIYVETPSSVLDPTTKTVSDALRDAAALGASVHRLSGATVASAVMQHLKGIDAPHIVLAVRRQRVLDWLRRGTLVEELAYALPQATFHAVPGLPVSGNLGSQSQSNAPAKNILLAVAAVLVTTVIAMILREFAGVTYLSILFLFPVITASARLGALAAVVSALLATLMFNLIFLAPDLTSNPLAVQSWIMGAVLVGVALYASWLTGTLRNRMVLSDRNANESAALAAFAQELTRVSDWTSTADVVCREVNRMLGVNAVIVREIGGKLEMASAFPSAASFDPLDEAALDWAWSTGDVTGSGTAHLAEASWQFHPLVTSLGNLAILGISKGDGRDPVLPEQRVVLATVIAQASLAHERLRLEDAMVARSDSRRSGQV